MLIFHTTISYWTQYDAFASSKIEPKSTIDNLTKLTPDTSEYIWPIDTGYRITSSFAEFRSSHYHAGIDISTNMKEGNNVYASRDGYIYRIKILPDGYGKTLFVKHPDGYYTVYAHLKGFSNKIQEVLLKEQLNQQSYFVDLVLDSSVIPVRKKELIAYSGSTGVGPPHLHFEILDENFNPVNPLHFPNFRINDRIAPFIKKIFIAPASEFSMVMGKDDYYIIKINSNRPSFKLQNPIKIYGKIRLGIETRDYNNISSVKTGIYKILFKLNDSLIFQSQYDRITTKYTHEILLHYDLKLLQEGSGKFKKLYVEEGTNLQIYNYLSSGSGIIDGTKLKEGLHNFTIIVADFYGNKSEVHGNFFVDSQDKSSISHAKTVRKINKLPDNITLTYKILNDKIKCLLKSNQYNPNKFETYLLEGEKKTIINLKNIDDDNYAGYVEPDANYHGYRKILVVDKTDNKLIKSTDKFFVYPVKKGLSKHFTLSNNKIIVSYNEESVYKDFLLTVDSSIIDNIVIYEFNPKDVPLKNGIDIKIRNNSRSENIYFKKNGKWVFQRPAQCNDSGYIKATFNRTLTDVTLLKDTIPPIIQVQKKIKLPKYSVISFRFKDNLSGVDYNKIKMYINKEVVIPEIDEEKRKITYSFENEVSKKIQVMELEIPDRAGNIQKLTRKF